MVNLDMGSLSQSEFLHVTHYPLFTLSIDLAKGGDSVSDAHCDPAGIGDNDLSESEDDAATLNLDAVQI